MGLFRKINEVGFKNTLVGAIRREYYKKLKKTYDFGECHYSTYELRKYLQEIAKYVNSQGNLDNEVIDIGCGLGELLRHIKVGKRVGFDLDGEAIRCAQMLDKSGEITFIRGTFDALGEGRKIDYLSALGFMHGSTEDKWVDSWAKVTADNDVRNIIVDVFKENPDEGSHKLDFTKILPSEYHLIERMGPFLGEKYVEIYSKE